MENYGNYSSSNYGLHTLMVSLPNGRIYYSYKTPIAFYDNKNYKMVISENCWSNTTGKHLNWINRDKSVRIPRAEFEKLFEECFGNSPE